MNIQELLPLLIPLLIIEFGLLAYTIYHIMTHTDYRRFNRKTWLIIVIIGMNFVGPILYFVLGKENE